MPLICFGGSYVVFVSSAWKTGGMTVLVRLSASVVTSVVVPQLTVESCHLFGGLRSEYSQTDLRDCDWFNSIIMCVIIIHDS